MMHLLARGAGSATVESCVDTYRTRGLDGANEADGSDTGDSHQLGAPQAIARATMEGML